MYNFEKEIEDKQGHHYQQKKQCQAKNAIKGPKVKKI